MSLVVLPHQEVTEWFNQVTDELGLPALGTRQKARALHRLMIDPYAPASHGRLA